jgi:predicted nucleotidyltransferase
MHSEIAAHRDELAALCRRFGVRRLEIFGSAARGTDFDPETSDADFLVEFDRASGLGPLEQYFGFAEALEALLGRSVDLVEKGSLEQSGNYIRRRYILAEAETVYG